MAAYPLIADTGLQDEGPAISNAVDLWLSTVQTLPALHWANIARGGYLLGTNAVTNMHRGAGHKIAAIFLTFGMSELLSNIGGSSAFKAAAEIANAITDELKDPNIEGIPIHAVKETGSRDIDIQSHMVIAQMSAMKEYIIDNAVPQPKQWQINGYITAIPSGIDPYLVIKPSMIIQDQLLDMYAKSRKPVWFKTHDNRFHLVLIKHYDSAYDPQYLNGMAVNITLTEFKVMETSAVTLPAITALKG